VVDLRGVSFCFDACCDEALCGERVILLDPRAQPLCSCRITSTSVVPFLLRTSCVEFVPVLEECRAWSDER
jgi:hypothetical protein